MTKRTKRLELLGNMVPGTVQVCESKSRKWSFCEFCGKFAAKRKAVGIWGCKDCGKVKAGGAYTLNTENKLKVKKRSERVVQTCCSS